MMSWLPALLVTLAMQSTTAFLNRALPVIGPAITESAGVTPERIGHLASLTSFGTMLFFVVGTQLLKRYGPVRLLQVGASLAGLSMMLGLGGWWGGFLVTALCIGLGYGPSAPAGSDILARHAPRHRRSLVFSIKQAGVPLGGALAGLILAPVIALAGWQAALVVGAILPALVAVAVQPWRPAIDASRDPAAPIGPATLFAWDNLSAPFRALLLPGIAGISYAGFCFAVAQGALLTFFVTFLTEHVGYSLVAAASLFALMQALGVVSRVAVGWIADVVGSARITLLLLAVASAALMAAVAMIGPQWPPLAVLAVAAVAGVAVASWNGVYLSEIASLAPPDKVGEATAGSTFVTFAGYVICPSAVALLVGATGDYAIGFLAAAAFPASAAVALWLRR
ncbi:MAG: MFS transporter [Thalassobaculales bacterium]